MTRMSSMVSTMDEEPRRSQYKDDVLVSIVDTTYMNLSYSRVGVKSCDVK